MSNELIEAAKDSALAKHKMRIRKLAPVTSNPNTVHAIDTVLTQGCYLREYTKFLYFGSVLDGDNAITKRLTLEYLNANENPFNLVPSKCVPQLCQI